MDVTESKLAEGALLARELNLRLIVGGIPAPVALMTPSGQVESVNRPLIEKTSFVQRWGRGGELALENLR